MARGMETELLTAECEVWLKVRSEEECVAREENGEEKCPFKVGTVGTADEVVTKPLLTGTMGVVEGVWPGVGEEMGDGLVNPLLLVTAGAGKPVRTVGRVDTGGVAFAIRLLPRGMVVIGVIGDDPLLEEDIAEGRGP